MKRHIHYAASGMRSTMFLTVLGCLLAAGLAGAVFQPASATRFGAQPVAAPQNHLPQIQELRAAQLPPAEAQDHLHGAPIEGGSVLEFRDGQASCRAATEAEAQAMRRDPDQQLRALSDEALAPGSPEQARKGLKIILRGTPQLEQFPEAKAAFLRAAHAWESLIQNPITVVIDVDFGPTAFGKPFGENEYGITRFQWNFNANYYPLIRSALIRSAGSPQEAALYNSLPPAQLPTDLGAATDMIYHVPAMRALGLFPPVADPDADREKYGLPPGIAFNSAESFDFDPSDGIKPKRLDFNASALHEIGHALGFFSFAGVKEQFPNSLLALVVLDLFRFRPGVTFETFSSAPRILSSGGEHIFFGGGPELPLSTGRFDRTGGDGQQAGHWKDDISTGRYIGIMDPTFFGGPRYEMTANDIEAFERIGYRMNPLPNPREAELKLDDGAIDTGALGNGLMVVNRLTPPSYPATLRKLRIVIPTLKDQPDPAGKPITLIYAQGASNSQPPTGAQFTRIETTVPSASNELFLEFTIPNGPTINSGDFYVGYQAPSPNQGVGFAADLSGSAENRSFYSTNNGASFAPFSEVYQGRAANAMIRAIVSIPGPTPTPTPVPTPTPTPGPDTVALTSGVPQDGYMAGSDGRAFETQYTIQVPSGATQLKIDLSANTDVDLYARFGSRVVVQNGLPLADYKSVSDNYHESITITPGSSPALQAGVYYIMLANYGPGPSTFTITATVTGGSPQGNRIVRTGQASGAQGGAAPVPIELVAQGDESALGFSLTFDPSVLSNPQARLGSDAASATLIANTSQIAQGRLGIALALPIGQKFGAGVRQIVVVNFTIASGANASSTPIGFGDQPVAREVSDENARALPASFVGGEAPLARGVVSVSAASFNGAALASEAIAAAFGARLATTVLVSPGTPDCPICLTTELAGTRVMVKDSAGTERPAPLFFVSPSQVNYLMPIGASVGIATVTVTSGDGTVSAGTAQIAAVAPGLFTANGDGQGAPAAAALRVKPGTDPSFEPVALYDSAQRRFVPRPLDLGEATDQVFLVLFGTGLRHHQALSTVSVKIGGVETPALYAGPQGGAGLDQVNLRLPRSLIGRGEVDVALIVDGKTANTVRINIR